MGFFAKFLGSVIGVTVVQTAACYTSTNQVMHESVGQASSGARPTSSSTRQTSSNTQPASSNSRQASSDTQDSRFCPEPPECVDYPSQPPATPARPTLIKEPDDLGTPDLPRPAEVSWLDDPQKVEIAINILKHGDWEMRYYWELYYAKKKPVEEIASRQEQIYYDNFWQQLRCCWKMLQQPFWKAYLAGHCPDPQVVKGIPALAREICVLDIEGFKSRQTHSLIKDGVYTLGVLQTSLFNDHWQPKGINDMDKWYFRKILMQYGLEVPPSDQPDPIPFAELFIGAVFGVKVTPQQRLSSYSFIVGDEPLEDRVQRIQKEGLIYRNAISDCEDVLFYRYPENNYRGTNRALRYTRRDLKARKILAGGEYPEVRNAMMEGVDLEQLDKISVQDSGLSRRAQRRIREHFRHDDTFTVADLVRTYHDWLIYEDTTAATEIKEYLYQQGYVIRPEDMPMDEHTHIAYLGLPTRVRMSLRYPGNVETVDDLVRCCSGNDPVFSLRYAEGIGKKSMEIIRASLVEFGFLTDSQ